MMKKIKKEINCASSSASKSLKFNLTLFKMKLLF